MVYLKGDNLFDDVKSGCFQDGAHVCSWGDGELPYVDVFVAVGVGFGEPRGDFEFFNSGEFDVGEFGFEGLANVIPVVGVAYLFQKDCGGPFVTGGVTVGFDSFLL